MARTASTSTDASDDTDTDLRHPVAGAPAPCWPRSLPAVLLWD